MGFWVGDKVIEVNGVNVEGEIYNDVVKWIKGNFEEVMMFVIDYIIEVYLKYIKWFIIVDMVNLLIVY